MKLFAYVTCAAAFGCGDNGGSTDPAPDAPDANQRCVPASLLSTMDALVEEFRLSADLAQTHPGPREAVGFYLFPKLDLKRAGVFAGPLIMECNGAFMYDEFCEEDGLCSRIECTGQGASWKMHFYVKSPVGTDPSYQVANVTTAWADGATGLTFETSATTSGTEDWSMTGSGAMDLELLDLKLTYPSLVPGGAVELTARVEQDGVHRGEVTVAGDVAATADPVTGRYVAVDDCN